MEQNMIPIELHRRDGLERVIHCRDCKYWDYRFGRNRCNRFALIENDKLQTHVCTQYDFCSYAEKE